MTYFKRGCHAEPVEAWWVKASARVLRQAQDDNPTLLSYLLPLCSILGSKPVKMPIKGRNAHTLKT